MRIANHQLKCNTYLNSTDMNPSISFAVAISHEMSLVSSCQINDADLNCQSVFVKVNVNIKSLRNERQNEKKMNSNTKNCAYKGCKNTSSRDAHLTFFGFPMKNPEKCEIWAELAGIDAPISKQQYLCETHFNPNFLSRTPRRTVLLPIAVPYAYNALEEEYVEKDLSTVEMADSVAIINDQFEPEGDDDIIIESKSKNGDEDQTESNDDSVFESGAKVEKRTSFDSSQLNCNNVTKRQKIHADDKYSGNMHVIDNTIENPDIVTFIFRGEEYIQMPKSIYLQQRAEVNAEVQKYKKLATRIKHLIDDFEM